MSHDDKVELIAIAQVEVTAGTIIFKSNKGFDGATRGSAGLYELQLDHKHDAHKIVVNVTRKALTPGEIQAEIPGTDDVDRIQVTNYDMASALVDTSFFITVWRVRS